MKLYIFAIGGTGSRVLKSLTMLLASGVQVNKEDGNPIDGIVPIIIDADISSGDLTRTVEQIKRYNQIRNKLAFDSEKENKFYSMKIDEPKILQLDDIRDEQFKKLIGLDSMSDSNRAMSSMLFSDKNLESTMEIGFKGNPNIGSVALNQFADSNAFKQFCKAFKQDDRIFIISSIFGGTGASGFPLLAKTLKSLPKDTDNKQLIEKAYLGAISVLPYFDVEKDDKSEIDSASFISKTKAALNYYKSNLAQVDQLYFIADRKTSKYDNHEGGTAQINGAHFVELAAALSIIDFVSIGDQAMLDKRDNNVALNVKEFGIKEDVSDIIFDNLEEPKNIIMPAMTRYMLFQMYLKNWIKKSSHNTWSIDHSFDKNFYSCQFYRDLTDFNNELDVWYNEMASQNRKFVPFELNKRQDELFKFVKGKKPSKIMSLNRNYYLYDEYLDGESKNISKKQDKEVQFVELFYRATKSLLNKKLNI